MQFTAWPEMLAWPYLILNGFLPYEDIAIAHSPLLIFVLTVFYKFFGVGIIQLQIFTIFLIGIIELLLYFVANKLYSRKIALLTVVTHLILLLIYDGYALWFDLALVPLAILLFYFVKNKNWLLAGAIFALGFLTKQTFIYFLIPILINKVEYKKFAIGLSIIFAISIVPFVYLGISDDLYKWSVTFGIFYLPHAAGQIQLPSLRQFLSAFIPFGLLLTNLPLMSWVLAGMMGIYPRWEMFHFQPALPFLALSISQTLLSKNNKVKIAGLIICFVIAAIFLRKFARERNSEIRFYENDVQKVSLTLDGVDSLYIINYWDNIYALTGALPPKPLIPYIPWYLNYENNEQLIINNLQSNMPEALVVNYRKDLTFEKLQTFINRYYKCDVIEKQVEVCFKN